MGFAQSGCRVAVAVLAVLGAHSACADGAAIAGLAPDRRPAGAPVIREFAKDAAWYARALQGVEQPYPASLRFLEDQGRWFTPFSRPGATGPYDIRRWHASADSRTKPKWVNGMRGRYRARSAFPELQSSANSTERGIR